LLSQRNRFEGCRIDSLDLNSLKSLNFVVIESIRSSSEPIRFWAGTQASNLNRFVRGTESTRTSRLELLDFEDFKNLHPKRVDSVRRGIDSKPFYTFLTELELQVESIREILESIRAFLNLENEEFDRRYKRTIESSKCMWGSCFHVGQELTSRLTVAAGGPPANVPATNLGVDIRVKRGALVPYWEPHEFVVLTPLLWKYFKCRWRLADDSDEEKIKRRRMMGLVVIMCEFRKDGVLHHSHSETKKLLRLVNVKTLKIRLGREGKEVIPYIVLLEACESIGIARSEEDTIAFSKVLDEAGVILFFIYKVMDLVRRAITLALTTDDDPVRDEIIRKLHEANEEINILAHKQVRHILWSRLGFRVITVGLFFLLTLWEFS
ncbi:hypothetical protein PIB30_045674, partial [Stylosanthes scabra]|nr:hypothetical protein [Stylosanthes scabra]